MIVRLMNGRDIRWNAALIKARLYKADVSFRRRFNFYFRRWIDKGLNDFYTMIKNYKR